MDRKSTDFWHKLNATRQTKCKSITYLAFNLPIVAFTLSGDPLNKMWRMRMDAGSAEKPELSSLHNYPAADDTTELVVEDG